MHACTIISSYSECKLTKTCIHLQMWEDGRLLQEPVQYQADMFVSEQLTQKLKLQLNDPLVVAANALPSWYWIIIIEDQVKITVDTPAGATS